MIFFFYIQFQINELLTCSDFFEAIGMALKH